MPAKRSEPALQLSYFGDTSQVYVRLGEGERVSVMRHNASRAADTGLAPGQPVWLSFDPADAILLTD
jgi:TOBE domain